MGCFKITYTWTTPAKLPYRLLRQIPNLLCVTRLALTPVCALFIARGEYRQGLLWFFIAGWTDFFDGFLARRMHWQSPAGAYLDPVADKVLMAGVYLALGLAGAVPWWLVALIFGRDLMILIGAAVLRRIRGITKFPPTLAGKVSTVLQICAALGVLASKGELAPEWLQFAGIWATAAGTAYSAVDYMRLGWRMMNQEPLR